MKSLQEHRVYYNHTFSLAAVLTLFTFVQIGLVFFQNNYLKKMLTFAFKEKLSR